MKRRTTIKSIAALGAAAALSPKSLLAKSANPKKLGIALVGLGGYATMQLAPALQQTEHCYLAGIVTGTPQKAVDWKKKYNIPAANIYNYENFDSIKDNPAIDVVYIVLPNFMHAEYTIRGFAAGKHVICEKPMGMNAEECKQMLAAEKAANKKLQIGYRLYYQPQHLALRNIGIEKKWGKVKVTQASLGFRMARPGIWRMDPKLGGGGAIMDLGVYCIQACRRMIGTLPVRVTAQGYIDDTELFKGIFETVTFQMEFPDGNLANCTSSFNAYMDRFHVACEQGWADLYPCFNAAGGLEIVSSEPIEVTGIREYQQTAQMDAFALNIKNDTEVLASGVEGKIDMEIIDTLKKAIASGKAEEVVYS